MTFRPLKLLAQLTLVVVSLGIVPVASSNESAPTPVPSGVVGADVLQGRVIVKYKADSTLMRALSASGPSGTQPRHASTLSQRLAVLLAPARVNAGPRIRMGVYALCPWLLAPFFAIKRWLA